MKAVFAICFYILLVTPNVAFAQEETERTQILVVGDEKEGVYLYATPDPKENVFTDFRVKIGKEMVKTDRWKAEMREERKPELHVVDLNHDGKKEVVVILTLGTGTWVVEKEAHILQQVETAYGKVYEEMDIDDPVHTIERDFKIAATDKTIQIKGRGHLWKAGNLCGETYYHHRFPLHQSVNWRMERNTLVADVGLTITSNCVPAGFLLRYQQRGEIYIAKQIEVKL